ncbi:MAG: hypothetical protein JEY79_12870 [Pseudodesulfovibrio sp.]|nr:hypothetical protein [Pseudodesulfovibrio sp.]
MFARVFKSVQICAFLLLFATVVSAQTVEPQISFGMKSSRSISPEVADIFWARGESFGSETGFGMRMSREFSDEIIGIIPPSPDGAEDLIGKASRALDIVPCRAISLVQLSGSVPDYGAMADVVKARLGESELFVLYMSSEESSLQGRYPSAMEIDFGDSLAQNFLEKFHAIIQE